MRILVAAVAVVVSLGLTSSASAATCSIAAGTATMSSTTDLSVSVEAGGAIVILDAVSAPQPCGTVSTIDRIEASSGNDVTFSLFRALGPGLTEEPGEDEIETRVTAPRLITIFDETNTNQTWNLGQVGSERHVNLNGDGDYDDFVAVKQDSTLHLSAGEGNDEITLDGSNAGGTPLSDADDGDLYTAVYGDGGNDRLTGPGMLTGGPGDDTLIGTGAWVHLPGYSQPLRMRADLGGTEPGADGFGGTDTYVNFATTRLHIQGGGDGNNRLQGGTRSDLLAGGDGDDEIHGGPGDDDILGRGGSDTLDGGPGDDLLQAEPGRPTTDAEFLTGGPGEDTIRGSEGPDSILGRDGERDSISCLGGNDTGTLDRVDSTDCEMPVATATIASASTTEARNLVLTVSLSQAVEFPTSVRVALDAGTATAPADFDPATQTATFAAGGRTATVTVPVTNDAIHEAVETFTARLVEPDAAIAVGDAATATILDDDPALITCTKLPLAVLEIKPLGRQRIKVSGFADPRRFAGERVQVLTSAGKAVGSAKVSATGSFSVTGAHRKATRFRAQLASGARSTLLRVDRRLRVVSRRRTAAGERVTFRFTSKRFPRAAKVTRRTGCIGNTSVGRVTIDRRKGTGKITLARPAAGDPIALYRITASIGGGSTYTLPIAVR